MNTKTQSQKSRLAQQAVPTKGQGNDVIYESIGVGAGREAASHGGSSWANWRNHPIVIITCVGFACAMGMAGLFLTVVVPVQAANYEKKLIDSEKKLVEMEKRVVEMEKKVEEHNVLEAALVVAQTEIEARKSVELSMRRELEGLRSGVPVR